MRYLSDNMNLQRDFADGLGSHTAATTGSSSTTRFGSSSGSGSIWDSLFSNLGGILVGTGGLITAIKADPNAQAQNQNTILQTLLGLQYGNNQRAPVNYSWLIWVVIAIIIAAILFAVLRKK